VCASAHARAHTHKHGIHKIHKILIDKKKTEKQSNEKKHMAGDDPKPSSRAGKLTSTNEGIAGLVNAALPAKGELLLLLTQALRGLELAGISQHARHQGITCAHGRPPAPGFPPEPPARAATTSIPPLAYTLPPEGLP
jgi:hypothetical protein